MALPTTGKISLGDVRTELGTTGAISLGSTDVRNLAEKTSGTIKMSDLRGKSAMPILSDNNAVIVYKYEIPILSHYEIEIKDWYFIGEYKITSFTYGRSESSSFSIVINNGVFPYSKLQLETNGLIIELEKGDIGSIYYYGYDNGEFYNFLADMKQGDKKTMKFSIKAIK